MEQETPMNLPAGFILCNACSTAHKQGQPCRCKPGIEPAKTPEPVPEQPAKFASGRERELHDIILNYCRLHGIIAYHARMDKKSGLKKGAFDFALMLNGRGICLEMKTEGGKLSQAQIDFGNDLERANVPHLVAYSDVQAIDFIRKMLLD